jgi:hypothetical protein
MREDRDTDVEQELLCIECAQTRWFGKSEGHA